MKTETTPLLQYLRRTPALSDGFYRPDSPHLYAAHDTITSLDECPFPLVTDSFRVLAFGNSKYSPEDAEKGHGHTTRFAIVEFVKGCGHLAHERISFIEGVKTFTSHGTTFTGESYSINDWARRIEYFRNTPCEVCAMVKHAVWIFGTGMGVNSRKLAMKRCLFLLDANYSNWREIVSEAEIKAKFDATKRNSL